MSTLSDRWLQARYWADRRWRATRYRLFHHRCYRCGLLGRYDRPPDRFQRDKPGLHELAEVPEVTRQQWERALKDARSRGVIQGSEYDPTYGQDLGSDKVRGFAVKCGVSQHYHPDSFWRLPGLQEDPYEFSTEFGQNTVFTREIDPDSPGGIGKPTGLPITAIWQVVRPHDCPSFTRYRPGRAPAEHVTLSEHRPSLLKWLVKDLATTPSRIVAGLVIGVLLPILLIWLHLHH